MPSEDAVALALQALQPVAEAHRSAVAEAGEELRGLLAETGSDADAGSLGAFASGRIDFGRFAGVLSRARTLDAATTARIRAASEVLRELSARTAEKAHVVHVPQGGSIRAAVSEALAESGRAFGAAHVAAAARQHASAGSDAVYLRAYPFAAWNARERKISPPLVLDVDGADLRAGDLAEFLDGNVKIAVVVRGDCCPAALVRLVTPGVFVAQFGDAAGFARLAKCAGPGVAALVPDRAAHFVHDPSAGKAVWERLTVVRSPADGFRRAVGPYSVEQQAEEMRQLAALATKPAAPAAAVAAAPAPAAPADPVDRLAAWLLAASEAPAHG